MAVFREDRIPYIKLKNGGLPYNIDPQVLFLGCNGLSDAEKITLLAMICFDHGKEIINKDGEREWVRKGYCEVSVETLANYRNCSTKTIRAHLNSLEAYGVIIRESTTGDNNSSTRKYFDFGPLLRAQDEVDKISAGLNIKKRLTAEENFTPEEQKCEPNKTSIKNNISSEVIVNTPPSVEPVEEQLNGAGIPSSGFTNDPKNKISHEGPIGLGLVAEEIIPSISSDFLSGFTLPKSNEKLRVSYKVTGVRRKIALGKYDDISPKDIVEYFKEKYALSYNRSFNVPVAELSKTLAMLKSGFLNKYSGKRSIEIVDLLFKYHKDAGLATADYPRPSLNNLTQDWIINKLLDCEDSNKRVIALTEKRIEEQESVVVTGLFDPINPVEISRQLRVILTQKGLYNRFIIAAKNGYISQDLMLLITSDPDGAEQHIKEVLDNAVPV